MSAVLAELEMLSEIESSEASLVSIGRPVRGVGFADAGSYEPRRYEEEKVSGARRPNGTRPLKRLKALHRRIIAAATSGKSVRQIADEVGRSYSMVYQTLQDPLAEREMEIALAASRHQLRALQIRGVEVVGGALASEQPMEMQLKGVDRLLKMQEMAGTANEGKETAEDVARKMLAAIQVNVKVVNDGRVAHIAPAEAGTEVGAVATGDAERSENG